MLIDLDISNPKNIVYQRKRESGNMKYAKLSKIGGELIEASEADYEDYKGFLKCPVCGDTVFLRKQHTSKGTTIRAAFIHHKAIPEISICELRIGGYGREDVEREAGKARGQRLNKARVSLWKYLRTNQVIDLSSWAFYKKDMNETKGRRSLIEYANLVIDVNKEAIIDIYLPTSEEIILKDEGFKIALDEQRQRVTQRVRAINRNRELHHKITVEMLSLILYDRYFLEIRHRILCVLCHFQAMKEEIKLARLSPNTQEWKDRFGIYLAGTVCSIFVTVDWVNIFDFKN